MARVTLKNDAGEREWICILEQQQFFQINFLVSSLRFSFARCGDRNVELFLVFSDFDRRVKMKKRYYMGLCIFFLCF